MMFRPTSDEDPLRSGTPTLPRPVEPASAPVVRRLLAPALQQLAVELPALQSALVVGADGLPLAALGLSGEAAGHLSVLAGSLHTMVAGTAQVCHGTADEPVDHVSIASGSRLTVLVTVPAPSAGQPLLAVTADGCSLTRMLVSARSTATYLAAVLEDRATS